MQDITHPHITRFHVSGFRSLKDLEIDFSPTVTVLIGVNGAGKSNILTALQMMRSTLVEKRLNAFCAERGGAELQFFCGTEETEIITCDIELAGVSGLIQYGIDFRFDQATKEIEVSERVSSLKRDQIIAVLKDLGCYQFHDTSLTSPLRLPCPVHATDRLAADGGNLAAVLHRVREQYPRNFADIEYIAHRALPSFSGFDFTIAAEKISLIWYASTQDKPIPAYLTSDGSLRLFALATLLHLPEEMLPKVIILDEPELGLHPDIVNLLAGMIQSISVETQLILSTQSPQLVDEFALDDLRVFRQVNGATSVYCPKSADFQNWLEAGYSAGALWVKNLLGGHQ